MQSTINASSKGLGRSNPASRKARPIVFAASLRSAIITLEIFMA